MASTPQFYLGGYEAKTCPEKLRKDYDPAYDGYDTDPIPTGVLARMESGVAFEASVKALWQKALKKNFAAIDDCDRSDASKKKREKRTMELIANPGNVTVIWNARLPQDRKTHRTGEPDALLLVGTSPDGKPQWAPIDVKDHRSVSGTAKTSILVSELGKPHPGKGQQLATVGTPQKSDALQLAHYQRMLENLGYADPSNRGGIIGRELTITWHDLNEPAHKHDQLGKVSALAYYDYEFAHRVTIAGLAIAGKAPLNPEWKSECESCKWRTACNDELRIDLDHITLLPGITPARAQAHYAQGISTIKDLARLDWTAAALAEEGIDTPGLLWWATNEAASSARVSIDEAPVSNEHKTLLKQYGLSTARDASKLDSTTVAYHGTGVWKLSSSIDQARVSTVGKIHRARGVAKVGLERVTIEQDIDIEDYNGYVYLIGVRTTGRRKNGEDAKTRVDHKAFANWDKTDDGEARIFAEFWEHITSMLGKAAANRWGYRAYYFSHHEPTTFKRLARKHAGKPGVPSEAEVEAYFDRREVNDLRKIVETQFIWPTTSHSLKELAKWVRFCWRDDDPGGGNSMAWYAEAVGNPDPDVREENRTRLLEYNADDVSAQVAIRDFITQLEVARTPGKRLPDVDVLEKRFKRK